jgi:hypothetical protein
MCVLPPFRLASPTVLPNPACSRGPTFAKVSEESGYAVPLRVASNRDGLALAGSCPFTTLRPSWVLRGTRFWPTSTVTGNSFRRPLRYKRAEALQMGCNADVLLIVSGRSLPIRLLLRCESQLKRQQCRFGNELRTGFTKNPKRALQR